MGAEKTIAERVKLIIDKERNRNRNQNLNSKQIIIKT